ncbi:MAG TPA: family 16 glycosylhydrolase, partial [Lacipirellulaceae bacterium]|nr:family 16 glycosylhydrolase [Lacipirellulaceae bacterium]
AKRQSTGGKPYSSGVISSHDTFRFTYGYIEMRLDLTDKRGSWPAFWMLDSGWPPEIDIMEYPLSTAEAPGVNEDRYYTDSHWATPNGNAANGNWNDRNVDLGAGFHTYGLEWSPTGMAFYFDDQWVRGASNQASFQNMYTIFNLAVGGWPGAPTLEQWADGATDNAKADWYRVWQKPSTGAPAASTWTFNGGAVGQWNTDANWTAGNVRYERQRANFGTLAGRTSMLVSWSDSKTVGEVRLSGTTNYFLGAVGGDVESLMFADNSDGWGLLSVDSGAATHVFNGRIDAWSNIQVNHQGTGILRLVGGITGQARPNGASSTGAILRFTGPGTVIVGGDGSYQRDTRLEEGANVQVTSRLYVQDSVASDAAVRISGGSRLQLVNFNNSGAAGASLGYLPNGPGAVTLDNGTLVFTGTTSSTRSFTLFDEGGTLEAAAGASVNLSDAAGSDISAISGGPLALGGAGTGNFLKILGGSGMLVKRDAGTWRLGGANTYTGATLVEGGELAVTGRTGTGPTTVAAGGILSGGGQIVGPLNVFGSLSPGFGVGAMTAANVTLEATSTWAVELMDAANYDQLQASGSLAIAPGASLRVSLAPGSTYAPVVGDVFTLATAAGGVTGAGFTGLDLPEFAGFDWAIDLLPTSVALRVVPTPDADVDGSGRVDGGDFVALQRNLGATAGALFADGDANRDGAIDVADLNIWRAQFGGPPQITAGSASVPEPASFGLAALACLAVGGAGYRRRIAG